MDPSSATSAGRVFPAAAAAAFAVGPGSLHHVTRTGSTNADLVTEAEQGIVEGVVLVADHQTAGRGRLDRRWIDDPGAGLLVSVRLPADEHEAGASVRAFGAAARAALDELCTVPVLAKWPNDLVVLDPPAPGKLAGVLGQFVPRPIPCVVLGIGVNVSLIRPGETAGREGATSVSACGGPDDRDVILAAILRAFARRTADPDGVIDELRNHSATLGSLVRVELPGDRTLVGRAVGLTADGALVVEDDAALRHEVQTGDVVHLRRR